MFPSVIHLLFKTIETYADRVALKSHFEGPVKQYTYRQFGEMIEHLMLGMLTMTGIPNLYTLNIYMTLSTFGKVMCQTLQHSLPEKALP